MASHSSRGPCVQSPGWPALCRHGCKTKRPGNVCLIWNGTQSSMTDEKKHLWIRTWGGLVGLHRNPNKTRGSLRRPHVWVESSLTLHLLWALLQPVPHQRLLQGHWFGVALPLTNLGWYRSQSRPLVGSYDSGKEPQTLRDAERFQIPCFISYVPSSSLFYDFHGQKNPISPKGIVSRSHDPLPPCYPPCHRPPPTLTCIL